MWRSTMLSPLSADQLFEDVLHHYRTNVWPKVAAIVASHSNQTSAPRIILEGSALWPGFVTSLDFNRVAALWLTASEELFRQRIHQESRYHSRPSFERTMVDKFPERTLVYNAKMTEVASRLDFILVDVSQSNVAELTERCLSTLRTDHRQVSERSPTRLREVWTKYIADQAKSSDTPIHCSFPSFTTRHSPEITDKLRDVPRCPGVGITPPAI